MVTLKIILLKPILSAGKTNLLAAISKFMLFLNNLLLLAISFHYISGIFSFAGIKKPPLILINKPVSMVALLTKTKNGMRR
jgi:hypothetical protein